MDDFNGKKLVILGMARQGKALARFAAETGASVVVSDLRSAEILADSVAELRPFGVECVLGEHPLSLLDDADYLAVSGGVPLNVPIVRAARERGVVLTNDSLEFIKRTPAVTIGITGSAGKTTTTALTGAMGVSAERNTFIGGNIGRPLIGELAQMQPGDLVVQELSSFQLELWDRSPHVSAVTNITPNHLDRHKTMKAYANAKANILRYQTAEDISVLAADDPGAMALAGEGHGRLRTFSLDHPALVTDGACVQNGQIVLRNGQSETVVCGVDAIQLRGRHNIANVLTAVVLADSVGISAEIMAHAIAQFKGVEHRLELVATLDGVSWINDSIATAPERALAALNAFDEPLILLAGGKDKDMVWDAWAQRVHERVRHVILFGALAEQLEQTLSAINKNRAKNLPHLQQTRVTTLAEAVEVAHDVAQSGDIVLLSPGGTSYDAYVDFAQRGAEFRALVHALASEQSAVSATS